MPYVRVWKFRAAPGRTADFASAYGPAGDWARLFRLGDGYLGTELLHPAQSGGLYLTIDRWRSEADWQRFLETHGAAYRALDARLAPLCAEDTEVGTFSTP
jgi:heme-degrading monooxygenase HmoA